MAKQTDGLMAIILIDKFCEFEKTIEANRKDCMLHFSPDGSIQKFSSVYYGNRCNYQFNLLLKVETGNCTASTWVEKVVDSDNYIEGIWNKYPAFI